MDTYLGVLRAMALFDRVQERRSEEPKAETLRGEDYLIVLENSDGAIATWRVDKRGAAAPARFDVDLLPEAGALMRDWSRSVAAAVSGLK